MDTSSVLHQLSHVNEVKRRKKQAVIWSAMSVIVFIIAYMVPLGNALAGRVLLSVVAIIGLSSIATLILISEVKPQVTKEQASLLGLDVAVPSESNHTLTPAFDTIVSERVPARQRRLSLTPPKPSLPLTPPQQNCSNFTKSAPATTSPTPTRFTLATPSKQYTYSTSPIQEKRVIITATANKRNKIEMQEYIKKDIDDRCVDALRKCLGQHLQESAKRFAEVVHTIVQHMIQLHLVPQDASQNLIATLQYDDNTSKNRFFHRPESSLSVQDIMNMIRNMQPQHIPQQLHPVASALQGLIPEYDSLLQLHTGMTSSTSSDVLGYGIKRCRELAVDGHLGRVHWASSTSSATPIPDAALVMSIFFHYADSRSLGSKNQHTFSVMHYIDDCGDAPPNKVAYANIRIARRSPVHYNLYIDTPSAKQAYNEICIEAGRQNAFLTIVLFLQSMVQMADKMRGSLAPIKDLVEDVLGVDAVY